MDALNSLETLLAAAFAAAALLLVAQSVRKGFSGTDAAPPTGEALWSLVAVAVMAGTALAVCGGAGHAF